MLDRRILRHFLLCLSLLGSSSVLEARSKKQAREQLGQDVYEAQESQKAVGYDEENQKKILGGRVDLEKMSSRIDEYIQNASIAIGGTFLNYTPTPGLPLKFRVRFEDKPSFVANNYTRSDLWQVELNTNFLELLGKDTTFGDFGITPYFDYGFNFFFARQHNDKRSKAVKTKPILPSQVPLSADRALRIMKVDDFFALPSHFDVGVRVSSSAPISGSLTAKAGFHYRVGRADVLISVFRENSKQFNIKVVGIRRNGHGMFGKIDSFFGLMHSEKLNEVFMEKIIGTNLFSVDMLSSERGDLHISDYTLDLTTKEGARAYNSIFKNLISNQQLKLLNPFRKNQKVKDLIARMILPMDKLARRANKKYVRNFVGSFKFNNDPFRISVGNKFARYTKNSNYVENRVEYTDEDGELIHFLNTHHTRFSEVNFLWKVLHNSRNRTANMLLFTDEKFRVLQNGLSDYRVTDEKKDQLATASEQLKYIRRAIGNIGDKAASTIPWSRLYTKGRQSNLRVRSEVIINRNALYLLRKSLNLSVAQIRKELTKYMNRGEQNITQEISKLPIISLFSGKSFLHKQEIAQAIFTGLAVESRVRIGQNTSNDKTDKSYELARNYVLLEKRRLFRDEGLGFIMYLFEKAKIDLKKNVYVKLVWSSKEKGEKEYSWGTLPESSKLFNTLEFALELLGGRTFDIRTIRNSSLKGNLGIR